MNALLKTIIVATIVIPLAFSTAFAKQQGQERYGNAMPLQSMLSQLDLTEEQKVNIKTIMTKYRNDKKIGAFHDSQMSILQAPQFDEAQAKALIDSRNSQQMNHMHMMFDVYHSLTPEQQAEMDKLLANKKANKAKNGKDAKSKQDKAQNGKDIKQQ